MKTLRDESYSSVDVASRISRDVVLSAEVIRSATSGYRAEGRRRGRDRPGPGGGDDRHRGPAPGDRQRRAAADLRRRAATRSRPRPRSRSGATPTARRASAPRSPGSSRSIRSTATSPACCTTRAGPRPCAPSTASRTCSSAASTWRIPRSVPQLLRRRDALFGAIVGPWNLSPAIDRLAAEVGELGLDAVRSPLGVALREANRLAALHALAPAGQRPGDRRARLGDARQAGPGLLPRARPRRPEAARTADLSSRLAAERRPLPRAHPRGSPPMTHRIIRRLAALAFVAAAGCRSPAFAAKTLVYCSEGSPEGFNPQFFTTGTTARRLVGADLQPPGRVRARHDQHRARPGRELDRRARRPEPTPSSCARA